MQLLALNEYLNSNDFDDAGALTLTKRSHKEIPRKNSLAVFDSSIGDFKVGQRARGNSDAAAILRSNSARKLLAMEIFALDLRDGVSKSVFLHFNLLLA